MFVIARVHTHTHTLKGGTGDLVVVCVKGRNSPSSPFYKFYFIFFYFYFLTLQYCIGFAILNVAGSNIFVYCLFRKLNYNK